MEIIQTKNLNNTLIVRLLTFLLSSLFFNHVFAQQILNPSGCVTNGWGVDAGVYSGVIEFGSGVEPAAPRSRDWFQGASGEGIINEATTNSIRTLLQGSPNPEYEVRMKVPVLTFLNGKTMIDGVFSRDEFGGSGATDRTAYTSASKNGDDPANWFTGTSQVSNKNDIIDIGGHMWAEGPDYTTSDLWFSGFVNMADPGGAAYADFEFYVNQLIYNGTTQKISSGGSDLGHTAFQFSNGNVSKIGDFIVAGNLGTSIGFDIRIWISRADWIALGGLSGGAGVGTNAFTWAGTFDGAFNGAPFGYAGIIPRNPDKICGYVNKSNESPLAPPWGTKTSKSNNYRTSYLPASIAEFAINLSIFGLDQSALAVTDPCFFPFKSFIVKSRASQSFTAQLKDFAGPFRWGFGDVQVSALTPEPLSCTNEIADVLATPQDTGLVYSWFTSTGSIIGTLPLGTLTNPKGFVINAQGDRIAEVSGDSWKIQVDRPGVYSVTIVDANGCSFFGGSASTTITADPASPFFTGKPVISFTPPCNSNDGTITAAVSGATPPYVFELLKDGNQTPVQTSTQTTSPHVFTGLEAGSYEVRVKGADPCRVTSDAVVLPAPNPPVFSPIISNAVCNGDANGKIELGTVTGAAPLSFAWSTGSTSKDLLNRRAGTYTLTISDGNGCTYTYPYTITQPDAITATVVKTDGVDNSNTASIAVSDVAGGTSPYTYAWAKAGDGSFTASTQSLSNVSGGSYTLRITDANSCEQTFNVLLFEPEICNDGKDNSGNGLIDCQDAVCVPVAPTTITASIPEPCVDDVITYDVGAVSGITIYHWTLPANATLVGGQGTAQITVKWDNTNGGQICVQSETAAGCRSTPYCISVNVQELPPPAGTIIINNN